jgi:hypothetical protein
MEIEYINKANGEKTKISHISKGFKQGSDKTTVLQLTADDYINYVKLTHHSSLTSFSVKTNSNKMIQVGMPKEYDKQVE